jgi:hypothetical protein
MGRLWMETGATARSTAVLAVFLRAFERFSAINAAEGS